jgi:NAD(P)-dependent dehydrogenase (short-subunit alcohol dehydrogenase family)
MTNKSDDKSNAGANKVVLVIGAGVATGGSVAKRFAREGFIACMARRQGEKLEGLVREIEEAGGQAFGYSCDATQENQVVELVERIERDVGPIEVACYNAAVGASHSITEFPADDYERVWRINTFGAFVMGREVSRRMVERGRGTILFTGATSALRGKARLAAFAGSKHALRALSESMARELFPLNIHVAHIIIDGPIDTPLIRRRMPQVFEDRPEDGVLAPDDIAETYWTVHCQPRSAWLHETQLRPWVEPW